MEILARRWYEALFWRRSRRRYEARAVPAEAFERLAVACNEFRPFDTARAVITEGSEKVFKGIIGAYGKIRCAPYLIAFIGDMRDPYVQEKVGYTGEGIVLEATALALGTCWVGKSFDSSVASSFAALRADERVLAVTPVGYAAGDTSFEERLLTGFGRMHKRKPLAELASGLPEGGWPEWIGKALVAAAIAPSAVNRQPWRFRVDTDRITVSVNNARDSYGISKRLDCGIAMLHIKTAARVFDVEGEWEFLDPPGVAAFTGRRTR